MKNLTSYSYKALIVLLLIPFLNSCSTQSALNTTQLDVEGAVAVTAPAPEAEAEQSVEVIAIEDLEIEEALFVEDNVLEPIAEKEKFGSNKAIAAKNPKGYKTANKIAKAGTSVAEANPVTGKMLEKADKIASKLTKKQGITSADSSAEERYSLLYIGLVLLLIGILVALLPNLAQVGGAVATIGLVLIIIWLIFLLL